MNAPAQPIGYESHPNAELQSLWDYWNGVARAAKNAAQRNRAERKLRDIGAEMSQRGLAPSNTEARARAGFMS